MKQTRLKNGTTITETAHAFEGLPDGDERIAKVKLAGQINDRIAEFGLRQKEAAELLGITQPEVSYLSRGRLSGFTFDRLYRCLVALDMDIEILVKKHPIRATDPAGVYVQSQD